MKIIYALIIIFLSALIGTALGELIYILVPTSSYLSHLFSTSVFPAWEMKKFDLIVLDMNFVIQFKLNILSVIGMVLGAFYSIKKL